MSHPFDERTQLRRWMLDVVRDFRRLDLARLVAEHQALPAQQRREMPGSVAEGLYDLQQAGLVKVYPKITGREKYYLERVIEAVPVEE